MCIEILFIMISAVGGYKLKTAEMIFLRVNQQVRLASSFCPSPWRTVTKEGFFNPVVVTIHGGP